ncbi:MAG: nitroreductase family protein [Chloroflexota bacterium]|nr:nitroreductase family protein [Chloroflexota bacterium]
MDNPALTTYPVIPVIANRWSPRAFDPKRLLDAQTVGSLFEAARWAPSSGNEQPWRYIVGLNFNEAHRAVLDCLAEGNRLWAANAPLLFVAVSKTTRNDRPNPHFAHDVGASLENLFLQAIDLGLHCHYMAGFSVERVRQTFGVPDGFEPVTACAVGYWGNLDQLPDELKQREQRKRERKPFSEFVFTETWEQPMPGLDG